MTLKDIEIIQKLQDQGYLVVVSDPLGETFIKRYEVFQQCSKESLKRIPIDKNGEVIGLQG